MANLSTIRGITERIRRILSTGYINDQDRVKNKEIELAIQSVTNQLLKIDTFSNIFNYDGESIPDGCVIATYDNQPVERYKQNWTTVPLPATPIGGLPDKMGVWSVARAGYPLTRYINLPSGMYQTLLGDKLMNPINTHFYTWEGMRIIIFDDLVGAGISGVDIQLCIMDLSLYGENDPLPIPADMEAAIIDEVVKMYSGEQPERREESLQPSVR